LILQDHVEDQMSIPAYEVDSTKFLRYPAQDYMPSTYVAIPGGVPMMGAHWIDVTTDELNGKPFTQTFLYGSYGGKVSFFEPMIILAFLKKIHHLNVIFLWQQNLQRVAIILPN
jgi:hypothetical protein